MKTAEEFRKANRRADMTASDIAIEKLWETLVKSDTATFAEFKQSINVAMQAQRYASWVLIMSLTNPTESELAFKVRDTKINYDDVKWF